MEDCLAGDPEKVKTQSVCSWICMLDIDGTVELSKEFHGPVRFSRKFRVVGRQTEVSIDFERRRLFQNL